MDSEGLRIDFWDVGQGDCSVITLPNGEFVVVDVGPIGSPLVGWLGDRPSCAIKAVVLTHNHEDHIGALQALVNLPQVSIGVVYMLVDQNPKSDPFRRIMRPVRDAVKLGRFRVLQLTAGQLIWAADDGSGCLKVEFPDLIGNIDATTQNETSGILTLKLQRRTSVVWPGDAMLEDIATVVGAGTGKPEVLDGPHHGAPQDFRSRNKDTLRRISTIGAGRCYISLGTWNEYDHPTRKYIKELTKTRCRVSCSQLTSSCEPGISTKTRPVLASHALLGLRAPRSGVACRGAMRFTVTNGALVVDEWDQEHRTRVRARVQSPACRLRGITTKARA